MCVFIYHFTRVQFKIYGRNKFRNWLWLFIQKNKYGTLIYHLFVV